MGTLSALVPADMLSKGDAQNSHGRRELTDYSCALTLTCVHDGHGQTHTINKWKMKFKKSKKTK